MKYVQNAQSQIKLKGENVHNIFTNGAFNCKVSLVNKTSSDCYCKAGKTESPNLFIISLDYGIILRGLIRSFFLF